VTRRVLAAVCAFLAVAGVALVVIVGVAATGQHSRPACSAERVASLNSGLSYAEGYRAALVTAHRSTARSDRDIAATVTALRRCGQPVEEAAS